MREHPSSEEPVLEAVTILPYANIVFLAVRDFRKDIVFC